VVCPAAATQCPQTMAQDLMPKHHITGRSVLSATCREAVERERDVLALLAKLEPAQLTVASAKPGGGADNSGSQIELVVADGIEVLLPMAGARRGTRSS